METEQLSFRWQTAMSKKDWAMLGVLLAVSASLWVWVYQEYQKPFVDPSWLSGHVEVSPARNQPTAL